MSGSNGPKVVVRRRATHIGDQLDQTAVHEITERAELELISTQMLKQMLTSNDAEDRDAIRNATDSAVEGVLARDTATGMFQIINEADLQSILNENDDLPKLSQPEDVTVEPLHDYADSESLSLVSTKALRHVFSDEEMVEEVKPEDEIDLSDFNPYDYT